MNQMEILCVYKAGNHFCNKYGRLYIKYGCLYIKERSFAFMYFHNLFTRL